jgi:hypothetical protein
METVDTIPKKPVGSIAEFLSAISAKYVGNDSVLFRGQRRESWRLTPRIGRIDLRLKYLSSLLNAEQKLLADFERLAVPHVRSKQQQDKWSLLALAQHHGLPTRLLDWSSNPLVALWFAVERPADTEESAAVWAYDAPESDFVDPQDKPFELSKTMIFRPHHHDERIVAQAGWFTVHKYSDSTERFSSFEKIQDQQNRLQKYVIAPSRFPAIREELARCGVTRASLFPDLSGLCQHLTWKYEVLADEGDHDIFSII